MAGGVRDCASAARAQDSSNQKRLPIPSVLSQHEGAAHQLHQVLADGQAQPGAAEAPRNGGVGLSEGLPQGTQVRGRDADPGVGDLKVQRHRSARKFILAHADQHLTSLGEFHRVTDQIDDELLESREVAQHAVRQVRRCLDPERELLSAGHLTHEALDLPEDGRRFKGSVLHSDLACLDF